MPFFDIKTTNFIEKFIQNRLTIDPQNGKMSGRMGRPHPPKKGGVKACPVGRFSP